MEFVKFTPGEYLDFEKEAVQLRLDIAAGKAEMPKMNGPFGKMEPKPYTQAEILEYNKKWDPYNPLFNDPEYAKKPDTKISRPIPASVWLWQWVRPALIRRCHLVDSTIPTTVQTFI